MAATALMTEWAARNAQTENAGLDFLMIESPLSKSGIVGLHNDLHKARRFLPSRLMRLLDCHTTRLKIWKK